MIDNLLFLALGLMLLCLGAVVFLAVWVYRDAKSRLLDARVWTLVTILVPSFIGLLLYFLVGRKDTRRSCPTCGKPALGTGRFCGNCGTSLPEELPSAGKPVGKGLLISGLACVVLTIVVGFGSLAALVLSNGIDAAFSSNFISVSTVYLENSWGDQWSVSWHYTTKTSSHSIVLTEDGPDTLFFEGLCEEGPLTLRIWQGDAGYTFDLSGGETIENSVDLSVFEPGEPLWLELDNQRGEGKQVTFKAWWE